MNIVSSGRGTLEKLTTSPWRETVSVEDQANAYRKQATVSVPSVVWAGSLPPKHSFGSTFSCKVFVGGVPWDITEQDLNEAFGRFGALKLEWPSMFPEPRGRDAKGAGYVYVIFENERAVLKLLGSCVYEHNNGYPAFFYKVNSNKMHSKDVQVIPWQINNCSYIRDGSSLSMPSNTVFVGSLHGMMTAEGLAQVMNDLFNGVAAATIDTDKYKYPIGSGRVVFNNMDSYQKAIRAAFVELRTQKFSKRIQIDPFLQDANCSICIQHPGPYFCRDKDCFKYYCHTCWTWQHSVDNLQFHTPMMRVPRHHHGEEKEAAGWTQVVHRDATKMLLNF